MENVPTVPVSPTGSAPPPVSPSSSAPVSPPPKSVRFLVLLVTIVMFLATSIAGFYLFPKLNPGQNPQPAIPPVPSPVETPIPSAPDPTSDWEIYTGPDYTFRYPSGLKLDTEAAGAGTESVRVLYLGPLHTASGKTDTELIDGYTFVVAKMAADTYTSPLQWAEAEIKHPLDLCLDMATPPAIVPVTISGNQGYQYSVTGCFGDYTSTYIGRDNVVYQITQLYAGSESLSDYRRTTDFILSTFRFVEKYIP